MTVTVTPHLNFRGDARAALELYRSVFGGELVVLTFEAAGAVEDPAEAQQVMWGQVETGTGFRIMAFDVPGSRAYDAGQEAFFVSARFTDADEAGAAWERLAEAGSVRVPLGPAPWSVAYGMLTDRFGVTWVVDVAPAA